MFEIDTGLIFWTILSFGVLVCLLYWLVFPPLNKVLEQRKRMIEGGLAQAKSAQAQAEGLLQKYQQQLGEAEKRTAVMFDDARQKSDALREETLKKAQKEAFQIIENTKKDIDVYKRRAMQGLKEDIAEIVVQVTKKMIGKSLNTAEHLKLIETSIEELEKDAKRKA